MRSVRRCRIVLWAGMGLLYRTYEAGKNYRQDSGECEEYKRKMQSRSAGNAGED